MMAWPGPERDASSAAAGLRGNAGPCGRPSTRPDGTALLACLRRSVDTIEGATTSRPSRLIPLGVAPVDAALGGGLWQGALHEIAAATEAETAVATGFALAIAARCRGPVLWVAEDMALAESGVPYGPGLDAFGLAPERLVTVVAAKSREVLWAAEEALGCRGVGAVLGEVRSPRLDLTATRRLSMAAGRGGGLALLLRHVRGEEPSAAATRWVVGAAPSVVAGPSGPGPPRLALALARSRRGHPGSWVVEWNGVEQRFDLTPAHRVPVAQAALDRPRAAYA
jgi:protein ImuA